MNELKKIAYEAGVTTHKDVRDAINDNIDKETKNFGILEQIPYVVASADSSTVFTDETAKAKLDELGVKALYHIRGFGDASEGILSRSGIIPEVAMTKWYYDTEGSVKAETKLFGTRVAIWDLETNFASAISKYANIYSQSIVFLAVGVKVAPVIKLGSMNSGDSEEKKMFGIGTFTWDSDGNGVLRLATGTKLIKKEYTVNGSNATTLTYITPKKSGYDVIKEVTGSASVFAGINTGKGIETLWQENGSSIPVSTIDGMFAKGSAPEEDGLATNEMHKFYDGSTSTNYYKISGVVIRDAQAPDVNAINKYIQAVNSNGTNTADIQKNMVIPVTVIKGTEEADGKGLLKFYKSSKAYLIMLSATSLCVLHYSVTYKDDDSGLINTMTFSEDYGEKYPTLITAIDSEKNVNESHAKIYYNHAFTTSDAQVDVITLRNELYGGGRVCPISTAEVGELLELSEDHIPGDTYQPNAPTREYSFNNPKFYKKVTWQGHTYTNVFVLDRVLKRNMQITHHYYLNWYPSNEFKLPGSDCYNNIELVDQDQDNAIGARIDSVFVDPDGNLYKYNNGELKRITGTDSDEDFMRSMFLQFDEVQSTIAMSSDNSMGYDIADPDAADSGITKAKIILAQTVTYNGGSRAKGTFVAQFTTASGTKYALNWRHSSVLGIADSRYYNNAGANPFTSGTEMDPTKYISDDATFKSDEFRGIRGENTYLCKGTGAVYVRDTQSTEWYKVVIDPSMWLESN